MSEVIVEKSSQGRPSAAGEVMMAPVGGLGVVDGETVEGNGVDGKQGALLSFLLPKMVLLFSLVQTCVRPQY